MLDRANTHFCGYLSAFTSVAPIGVAPRAATHRHKAEMADDNPGPEGGGAQLKQLKPEL